jgi:hypothetical protein
LLAHNRSGHTYAPGLRIGFGYDFNALYTDEDDPNELYNAINKYISNPRGILTILQAFVPIFRYIVRIFFVYFKKSVLRKF